MWLQNDRSNASLKNFPWCIVKLARLGKYLKNIILWCLIRISLIRWWYDKAGSVIGTSRWYYWCISCWREALFDHTWQSGGPRSAVVTGWDILIMNKHKHQCPVSIDVNIPWLIPAPGYQGDGGVNGIMASQWLTITWHQIPTLLLVTQSVSGSLIG